MESCPLLKLLSLDNIASFGLDELRPGRRILLSQLTVLELVKIQYDVVEHLLNTIESPRCRKHRIEPYGHSPALLRSITLHVFPSFQHHLQSGHTVDIAIDYLNSLRLTVDEVYSLSVRFERRQRGWSSTDAVFDLIGVLFGQSAGKPSLEVTAFLSSATHWTSKDAVNRLRCLHHVDKLVWQRFAYTTDPILRALSEPIAGSDEWLCPKLSTLCLKAGAKWTPSPVLRLVERRGRVLETSGTLARLASLVINTEAGRRMDQATFAAIRMIIGDGARWSNFDGTFEYDVREGEREEVEEAIIEERSEPVSP